MKDQDYQIFEAYLTGDLTADQKAAHKNRIEQDQEYKESFELYQSINNHLQTEYNNEKELKEFADSVSSISEGHFKSRKDSKFSWLKIAAAACVIIAISLYFLLGNLSKPQYEQLAQIPTIHLTERSADGAVYTKAENAFNQAEYAEAISLFEQILKEDNQNESIRLYQAIAHTEQGGTGKARELYNEIIEQGNAYSEEALWFAALNELKEENYSACKAYLKEIKPSASRYEDAQNLLEKL